MKCPSYCVFLNFRLLQNSMSKMNSIKSKNPLLSKIKSRQVLRVISQQPLHAKSLEKSYHRNKNQLQVLLKIKRSLHSNNACSNPRKRSPLSTHKSKKTQSKRSPKLNLEINLKKLNKSQYKKAQNIASKLNLPSFRQYCVIGSSFIPLDSSDQKKLFSELMAKTVSTCDPQLLGSTQKKQCLNFSDINDQIQIFVPAKEDKNQQQCRQDHFQRDDDAFPQLRKNNKKIQSYQNHKFLISDKRQVDHQKHYKNQEQCKSVYCQTQYKEQKATFQKLLDAQTQYSSRKFFYQQKSVRDAERQIQTEGVKAIITNQYTQNVAQEQSSKENMGKGIQLTVQFLKKDTKNSNQEIKWKLREAQRLSINSYHSKEINANYKIQIHDRSFRTLKPESRNTRNQQNLQEVLLKLEFLHLPEKNCFQSMSKSQREHYSSLFRTLISQLDLTPRTNDENKLDRLCFIKSEITDSSQSYEAKNLCEKRQEIRFTSNTVSQDCLGRHNYLQRQTFQPIGSSVGSTVKQKRQDQNVSNEEELEYQRVKILDMISFQIELRQIRQLSLALPSNTNNGFTRQGIANQLNSLLTFLQLNYIDQTLEVLNRVYGYSYKDRFFYIRRCRSNLFNFRKLLSAQIYKHYIQQNIQSQQKGREFEQEYRFIFAHALFDCINQELDPYRPFFSSEGQPYPWSMKIIKSITYFTIDQQSIQIVFSQIKERILGYVSVLSGLLVDSQYASALPYQQNPIVKKRFQLQLKLVESWINEVEQTPALQDSCTQVLIALSDLVIDQLIRQIADELLNQTDRENYHKSKEQIRNNQ